MTRIQLRRAAVAAAIGLAALGGPARGEGQFSAADMQRGAQLMQEQMAVMTPELLEKAKALSPEIKQFLTKVVLRHERRSNSLTLVQVMHEILAEHQAVGTAIATDNGALAADAARRIARHRLPRGGMLPYLPIEKVTNEGLSVLPAMELAVEGNALKLAEAADKGDMAGAAQYYGAMTSGCVACHLHFRGQPGASAYVPRLRK
jgi:cytochrome c556